MIRFINCIKRRPDITVEQFRNYWNSDEFKNLIKQIVTLSGAKRYSKSATLVIEANTMLQKRRGSSEPFDGVLEYWWDKASHLDDLFNTAEAGLLTQKMLDFQKQFVDIANSSAFFTEVDNT
jgi:hypothetical protein